MAEGRAKATRDPLLGRVIDGRYTVLNLLGKGGMGSVYRAHQASLDRAVALKVLLGAPEQGRESEFLRRFFLEASTVAKLKHPNTITVFDYGSEEVQGARVYFIAMELLEGRTLTAALKPGALRINQTLSITVQICRSLREAHHAGVVHRDLKPGNIMLVPHDDDPEGDVEFVKVLDFGLAKTFDQEDQNLTKVGTFLGSPRYVSPEQIEGRATDPRSDIYALGCVMYRMITGEVPFNGAAPVEIMLKHLNEPAPELPPETPPLLSRLVADCLEKDPAARPHSMEEVIGRLKIVRAAAGERVGFMSISDDGDGQPTTPPTRLLPVVHGVDEPEPTLTDRPRAKSSPRDAFAQPLDETRPTRNVLHVPVPGMRSRGNVFVRGVISGTVIAAALLAGLELGLDEWLAKQLQPKPAAAVTPVVRSRMVRLEISTKPTATLIELEGGDRLPRGRTPLLLDWPISSSSTARRFVLERKGYQPAPLTIEVPVDDGTETQQVKINAVLRR